MQQDSPDPGQASAKNEYREGELTGHWVVLLLCACILLGVVVLSPPPPGSSYLHIGPIPIPDTCSFKNLTGLPCPGCGLTRSIVAGVHGDLRASIMYHRLGLLTLFYVFVQFCFHLITILVPSLRTQFFGIGKVLNRGIIVLAALYIFNWGYTLLTRV